MPCEVAVVEPASEQDGSLSSSSNVRLLGESMCNHSSASVVTNPMINESDMPLSSVLQVESVLAFFQVGYQ